MFTKKTKISSAKVTPDNFPLFELPQHFWTPRLPFVCNRNKSDDCKSTAEINMLHLGSVTRLKS